MKKPPPNAPSGFADRLKKIAAAPPPPVDPFSLSIRKGLRPVREDRRAVFKNGVLALAGGAQLNVVVKNVTSRGARIEFLERTMLPTEVQFASPMLGIRKRARVVWQEESSAGLEFID